MFDRLLNTPRMQSLRKMTYPWSKLENIITLVRGGSRAAATSKMECFVIIVNGWKRLTIITKRSILDVAAALDPPLSLILKYLRLAR